MRRCWHFWRVKEHFFMGLEHEPRFGCYPCRIEWTLERIRTRGLSY